MEKNTSTRWSVLVTLSALVVGLATGWGLGAHTAGDLLDRTRPVGETPTGAAGTVDGEYMPIISIWDAHSGERLAVFPNADFYSALDFSPDGSLLAAGSLNSILFFDMNTLQPAGKIADEVESVTDLQFSPDGSQLLTSGSLGIVQIWEME